MSDWVGPSYLEAEQTVIGCLLHLPSSAAAVRDTLQPRDFSDYFCREAYRRLTASFEGGRMISVTQLADQLIPTESRGELPFDQSDIVAVMESVMDHAPDGFYVSMIQRAARVVADAAARNRIMLTAASMSRIAADATQLDAVNRVAGMATEMTWTPIDAAPRQISDVVSEAIAAADRSSEVPLDERVVLSYFADLDRLIGGFHPGSMTVIAARPSVGKSSLLTSILSNACVKKKVPSYFVTVEVADRDAATNMGCGIARVDGHTLRTGEISDLDYQRWATAMAEVRQAPLLTHDASATTSTTIRAASARLAANRGIRLVAVDYLQFLQPESRSNNQNRESEVRIMSANLKSAAKEAGVAMLVAAQLNRGLESRAQNDRKPRKSDLRDSGSIEQDADVVILLHRAKMWGLSGASKESVVDEIEVIVDKNRNGPTGSVTMIFVKPWTRFMSPAAYNEVAFTGLVDITPKQREGALTDDFGFPR